jgi:hypothetical protein
MTDTIKKGTEGCGCVGAEYLMELEENCAAISAAHCPGWLKVGTRSTLPPLNDCPAKTKENI